MSPGGSPEQYPPGFEEDDHLRSQFIGDLLRSQEAGLSDRGAGSDLPTRAPRRMFQFWHDALDLPADVRECMRTWDVLRDAGVEYRLFHDASAATYISERYGEREVEAFERCQHPAMRSDYLRMCVILGDGGLYVDADDVLLGDGWETLFQGSRLRVQPLCFDINAGRMANMVDLAQSGFPADKRVYYLNNNPIAAPAGHPVLSGALARATSRLLDCGSYKEIQSTTGPGNFTAAFAAHARRSWNGAVCAAADFEMLVRWGLTSAPHWELDYRQDDRNWRNVYGY